MNVSEQLQGWKQIASYLQRSVRCVQRWEHHENLPVHRHTHTRGASIYAFRDELDSWWQGERRNLIITGAAEIPSTKRKATTSNDSTAIPPAAWPSRATLEFSDDSP